MKPRRKDETDEQYISRLEVSNASLRANNSHLAKAIDRVHEITSVSASRLGLLFDYAADICGMSDTEEHLAIKDAVDGLICMRWDGDVPTVPDKPNWKIENPDPPSDAGMILRSALEISKAKSPPWNDNSHLFPDELPPVESWDFDTLKYEIFDALSDLEFSRGLLRDDLRSAMFDHCMSRVIRAVKMGGRS